MHFVGALADRDQRLNLYGQGGFAEKVAPLFEKKENLVVTDILGFYEVLVAKPIMLRRTDGVTASRHSYNSMDTARQFHNVMQEVYGAAKFEFVPELWELMLKCQARPKETMVLLEFFGVTMDVANQLLRQYPKLNWTTLLVLAAEVSNDG